MIVHDQCSSMHILVVIKIKYPKLFSYLDFVLAVLWIVFLTNYVTILNLFFILVGEYPFCKSRYTFIIIIIIIGNGELHSSEFSSR